MAKYEIGQKVVAWNDCHGEHGVISEVWSNWDGEREQMYTVSQTYDNNNLGGVLESDIELL